MECHMKGHFYLRMEELLQLAGTFGINVISFSYGIQRTFKREIKYSRIFLEND